MIRRSRRKRAEKLVDRLQQSIEKRSTNMQTDETEEEKQLHKELHSLSISPTNKLYGPRMRIIAAQWFILRALHSSLKLQDLLRLEPIEANRDEASFAHARRQESDMKRAWDLLEFKLAQNEHEQLAFDLLKLDIAQKLRDHHLMAPVFERVVNRGDLMTYEEVLVAWTSAPLLGKWTSFRNFGDKVLAANDGSLDDFHEAALERSDICDYKVLYELASEAKMEDVTPSEVSELKWQEWDILAMQMRLQSVESDDEARAEEIINEIDPSFHENGHGRWDMPNSSGMSILQFAALGQSRTLSPKTPLVGSFKNRSLHMRGYLDSDVPDGFRVRETIDIEAKLTKEERAKSLYTWEGTYSLKQEQLPQVTGDRPLSPQGVQVAIVHFEIRLVMQPRADSSTQRP